MNLKYIPSDDAEPKKRTKHLSSRPSLERWLRREERKLSRWLSQSDQPEESRGVAPS
jgi:hypothetical protein